MHLVEAIAYVCAPKRFLYAAFWVSAGADVGSVEFAEVKALCKVWKASAKDCVQSRSSYHCRLEVLEADCCPFMAKPEIIQQCALLSAELVSSMTAWAG